LEKQLQKVERLGKANRRELLDLLIEAFTGHHPLVPALSHKPGATRGVMKAFLDFFGSSQGSWFYGLREAGKLVCASVSVDSVVEPSPLALIRFVLTLCWTLGWRSAKELELVHKEEPEYEDRYLELVILGTRPAYQRQGFGRRMLHFLHEEAKRSNFKGVILVADKDTPAFRLYLKESFAVDKECLVGGRTLCWMRRLF